jgi:hypothetical protein
MVIHGTMDGPWLGIEPTHKSFTCAFVNVVPFKNGKMQGEQLFLDLPALCRGRRYLPRSCACPGGCGARGVCLVPMAAASANVQRQALHRRPWTRTPTRCTGPCTRRSDRENPNA